MKTTKLFFAAIVFAGAASLALAQHGGHSGGGLGYPGQDHSMEDMQRKMKMQGTEEQRARLRTCSELSERLRMLAANIKNPANLSNAEFRQQWSGLLLRAMQGDHQAFLGSLNADQQAGLKDRLRKMDKVWAELASRFEMVDRDLAQTAPDAKLLNSHAKDLEKSLKKWDKQHRELGSEMGMEG